MLGPYWPWRMPIICTTGTLSECHPAGRHLQGVQLFTRYFIHWKYQKVLKEKIYFYRLPWSEIRADQIFLYLRQGKINLIVILPYNNCLKLSGKQKNSNIFQAWYFCQFSCKTWEIFGLLDLSFFGPNWHSNCCNIVIYLYKVKGYILNFFGMVN